MRIAVPVELEGETRGAATPETVRKFIALGAQVAVQAGAGLKSGVLDSEYVAAGASIAVSVTAVDNAGGVVDIHNKSFGSGVSKGTTAGGVAGGLWGFSCGPFWFVCVPAGVAMGMVPALKDAADAFFDAIGGTADMTEEARKLNRDNSIESWTRTAVHTERGLMTLRQLVLYITGHVPHHLRFIAEKRAALETASRS